MQAAIARAWADTKQHVASWWFVLFSALVNLPVVATGAFVSSNFELHPWQAVLLAFVSGTVLSFVLVFVGCLALARGGLMRDEINSLAARVATLEQAATIITRPERSPDPTADPVVHNGVKFVQRGVWADLERTPVAVAVCDRHNDAELLYKGDSSDPDDPDRDSLVRSQGYLGPHNEKDRCAYWCPQGHAVRFDETERHGTARRQVQSIMLADVIKKWRERDERAASAAAIPDSG
jgi:hypothetical protein